MEEGLDLVIRNGTIFDGGGGEPFVADIGVRGERIVAVGKVAGAAEVEIDAAGLIVTPGFVDVHTHYDGQVIWSSRMNPSSMHGVTTVVTGNCGVGFAPCRPADRADLIELMEGVEDIPEVVMAEGLSWNWESFPEYLDVVGARSYDVDIAMQLPHSALRLYVMGKRAIAREPAGPDDIEAMERLACEAMEAGAIGFGTSRTLQHRSGSNEIIPTQGATEAEIMGIARGMRKAGHGVIELVMDLDDIDDDFDLMENVARETGIPISYGLAQHDARNIWRYALERSAKAAERGLIVNAQIAPRGIGMLMGHDLSCNPFSFCDSYKALAGLPRADKIARLRDPEMRARILAEPLGASSEPALERVRGRLRRFSHMFPLGDPPDYEPPRNRSIENLARAANLRPEELAYDLMLEQDGAGLLYLPSGNYVDFSLDASREMMVDPHSVIALGDGGAHFGSICDASYPTFMLEHWTRERRREKLGIPAVVKMLTADTAAAVGLLDRGRIGAGYKADLNVIDYQRLRLSPPRVVRDLPAGGRRLLQDAEGYVATVLSGKVTYRHGEGTQQLPGRLVRGPKAAPLAA